MIIGKNLDTGKAIKIDLNNLIETRLLISSNSGGGKSFLARKILEESHGQVQQIVIDLEGEFATLRENYDYLLVGKDGEIPANIRTAELLARKLLELNVSTIIDLSELKHHERITFVKRFLDSMINSPKELWHNCLVFVDEAHHFCPQGTQAESTSAVIDLMTRGRKRGFCGILLSQRISKLHKDACAEANNRLIGRTVLDIDRKRASEELGFTSKENERSLRDLEAGEFYAFGTAISKNEIVKVKIGEVKTTHLKVGGKGLIKPSPTPENIKKILKNILDLPKEAEEELRTKEDMAKKIRELKTKVTILEKSKPKPETDEKTLEIAREQGFRQAESQYRNILKEAEGKYLSLYKKLHDVSRVLGGGIPEISKIDFQFKQLSRVSSQPLIKQHSLPRKVILNKVPKTVISDSGEEITLGLAEKKIYSLLCQYPDKVFSKAQLGVFTGYSHTSGGFSNSISRLSTLGLISRSGDSIQANEINNDFIGEFDFSKEAIISKLGKCEREIYEILLENPYQEFIIEELAGMTPSQYSAGSGGFSNSISRLNTFGILTRNKGVIKLNQELLDI